MVKPSKQFTYRAVFILTVIVLFILLQGAWFKNLFKKNPNILQKDSKGLAFQKKLNQEMATDSNNNGIPDWEERLWGLDPNVTQTNGSLNSDIIAQKRAQAQTTGIDIQNANASDKFSYNIYTATGVLADTNSTGEDQATNTVIKSLSKNLTPAYYQSKYQSQDIKIVPTTSKNVITYYKSIKSLTSSILERSTGNTQKDFGVTADTYYTLAQNLVKLDVPTTFARNHLILINDFAGMGDLLKTIGSDSIDQLGVANNSITYSQYSESINNSITEIAQIYTNYSIIKTQ